jgi:hypothetical protein
VKDLFGEAKAIIREFDFALRGRYGELEKTADPYGKFHHMSKYSSLYTEEEMERMILETDWGIMAAGFAAMLAFVMLALLRLDLIKSRAIVGFAGWWCECSCHVHLCCSLRRATALLTFICVAL